MTALTDAIRGHFIACVDAGRFDGDGLDKLLADVEAAQARAATVGALRGAGTSPAHVPATRFEILKGNADLEQPEHDAHVRAMEAREAALRG